MTEGTVAYDGNSVSPEALAGGPIGKLRDGDRIEIIVNRTTLEGSVNLVGDESAVYGVGWGTAELAKRSPRPDLSPDPQLPADERYRLVFDNAPVGLLHWDANGVVTGMVVLAGI